MLEIDFMQKIVVGLLSLFFLACQKDKEVLTYFGGGIVHPKDDYVILMQNNEILDSIKVDQNGHFEYRFKLDKPGLFTFRHAYEPQILYLEPQDSIKLRLNTLQFDESLVFAGKSAIENNFLIENYLLNQKNSDLILSYYKISPNNFQFKTDSIKKARQDKLKFLDQKYDFSDAFIEIAEKSIAYEFFDMRERYAFLLNKYNHKKAKSISDDFFSYRKKIDFDDEVALNLIGYQRFLDNYLKNQSIKLCKQKKQNVDCYDLNTYSNLDNRIHIVDSLIQNKYLRKRFFERFIQEEIIYAQAPKHLKHTSDFIETFDFSAKEKQHLQSLVNFQSSLLVNANLKHVKIKSLDFKSHELEDVMKKNLSVIYSWSIQSPSHHKLRIEKIEELKKDYPNIQFIGINIDYDFPNKWLDAVNKFDDNINNEFLIVPEKNATFYSNYLNKVFFLDKDCNIKKSEIILTNEDFDKHIKDFIASTN